MNIEQLKAAREDLRLNVFEPHTNMYGEKFEICNSFQVYEDTIKTIITLLDQAINAPDLRLSDLRLLVRRLAVKLPKDNKTRQQADDYLRRTFSAKDVLRDDEIVEKPEKTNAPELESLRKPIHETLTQREYDRRQGYNEAIDHLAPRIVREGFVCLPIDKNDQKE